MKYLLPIAGVSLFIMVLTSSPLAGAHQSSTIGNAGLTTVTPTTLVMLDLLQDSEHSGDDHDASPPVSHGDNGASETAREAAEGGHGEPDLGQQRAAQLAVHEPPAWYGKVVWGAGLLFVLAATLGSAAIVLKGPEPPDPADDHGHH